MKFQQVYFVVDTSFRLLWTGGEWDEFALANSGSGARSNEVLSTSLLSHVTDAGTRHAITEMAHAVLDTHLPLRIDYRCDSHTVMRRYLMTIQPMKDNRLLFVHDLRDVQSFTDIVPWRYHAGAESLKCSFCCSVKFPDGEWCAPESLGEPHPLEIDYTLCPDCEDRIAETVAALRSGRKPTISPATGFGPEDLDED